MAEQCLPGEMLVVAIDVGTTYSGYAWSFADDKYTIQAIREVDPNPERVSGCSPPGKVPTALLVKPDGTFHSFGHKALQHYNFELSEDEQKHWLYFERFKMKLHRKSDLSRDTKKTAANGKRLRLESIFAHVLCYFRKTAIKHVSSSSKIDVDPDDVKWVITVPAIWNDGAKQIMREAAYKAGLTSSTQPDKLIIALEPEAAALYCKSANLMYSSIDDPKNTSEAYTSGTKYLLADLGGGTVDVAVHEVRADETIRELHHATGGAWGGTSVDLNFVQLLKRIFGKEIIEKFQKENQGDWIDLISVKFEAAKRSAEAGGSVHVELPFNFHNFMKKQGLPIKDCINSLRNENLKFARGFLHLKYPEVMKLFGPVFTNITSHLKSILGRVADLQYVVLVGGFATCSLLQKHLKEELEHSFGVRVMTALDCSLAVVIGSVLFGHDPTQIASRRTKYTYGIESSRDFEEGVDPRSHRVINKDGIVKCKNTFNAFVRKNTEMEIGEEIMKKFAPLHICTSDECTEVNVIICTAEEEFPRYTTDHGVQKTLLRLPVDKLKLRNKTVIKVYMEFGATEVRVRAVNTSSGKDVRGEVKLDFPC